MSPFRSVQKSRGKNVTTEEATTADKAEGTTEDSETTGETTDDKAEGTTEDSETTGETTGDKAEGTTEDSETTEVGPASRNTTTGRARNATTQTLHDEQCVTDAKNHVLLEVEVANVETIAINTTDGRVDGTTEGSETIEVDNGNSVAPSTTTIGRARSATTRISPSETCVTDAMNLALAVEVAVGVGHETTTDDRADETVTSGPPTVATDDRADGTTEDSETTETVETDAKADGTTVDPETTGETTDAKADGITEDSAAVVVNEMEVDKTNAVQPVETGSETDGLNDALLTAIFVGRRGNGQVMHTTDHPVISEPLASLSEKTSEWMWPRERRITLPQRP